MKAMATRLGLAMLFAASNGGCRHVASAAAPRVLEAPRQEPEPEPWPIDAPQFPLEPRGDFRPCTVAPSEQDETTIWSYDERGRPVLRVLELSGEMTAITHVRYDEGGDSVSETQSLRWGREGKPPPSTAVHRLLRGGGYQADRDGVTIWRTDEAGRLESREQLIWMLGGARRVVFQRDAEGRVTDEHTRAPRAAGDVFVSGRRFGWSADGRTAKVETEVGTPDGTQWAVTGTATYDDRRRLVELVFLKNRRETFRYDGPGDALRLHEVWNLATSTEELLDSSEARFDDRGRIVEVARRGHRATRFSYACHADGVQTLPLTPDGWTTKGRIAKTRREGPWETFDEKGRLVQRQEFHDGVPIGKPTLFRADGSADGNSPP